MSLDSFAATSRKWPNATKREIEFLIATAKRCPKFIRVSQARLNSCKWGPYYGLVTYRLHLGSRRFPIITAYHAATRSYKSEKKAFRIAKTSKHPLISSPPGAIDPTKFYKEYNELL